MIEVSFAPADAALYTEIYQQLKRRACALRRGQHGNTLDTTALVHESFIKLVEMRARVHDRAHLFRLAALAMRQIFIDHLRERGIGVQVNYIPVYWHPLYADLGYRRGMCPVAEEYYEQEISLPMFPDLSDGDVDRVIGLVRAFICA